MNNISLCSDDASDDDLRRLDAVSVVVCSVVLVVGVVGFVSNCVAIPVLILVSIKGEVCSQAN